jgi:hypothetical protein
MLAIAITPRRKTWRLRFLDRWRMMLRGPYFGRKAKRWFAELSLACAQGVLGN